METLNVVGGVPLEGTVRVSGAKNAALPLLAATLLPEGTCVLRNVPDLADVRTLTEILREVGLRVVSNGPHSLETRVEREDCCLARYELVSRMRASIYLLGPLLARRGRAQVSLPGGCVIGLRPVDLHIKGLRALGAEIALDHGYIVAKAPRGGLRGAHILLRGPRGSSVGATANTLMAAVLARGQTVIECAAREPEIDELAGFLNRMGARVEGIGTSRLTIEGVQRLEGTHQSVVPDRIEAGTYMVAAAATGGDVRLDGVRLEHLEALTTPLIEAGVSVEDEGDGVVRVRRTGSIQPLRLSTEPYPGFPTDLQAQLTALLALADGTSVLTETIYPDRFLHLAELNRMGADIQKREACSVIRGVTGLTGADVRATDLRAGAALVVAGLAARGRTRIHDIHHIDRGYEGLETKLTRLGGTVYREAISRPWRRAA